MIRARETVSFLREFLSQPNRVGAIAPSSTRLAKALVAPLAQSRTPVAVLEIGAGTGAITRQIARVLKPEDRLDVCEASPELARYLEDTCLRRPPLDQAFASGRVRLFTGLVQQVRDLGEYDFIICGVPFTALPLREAREILTLIKRCSKPDCVFSYFEYIGIRPAKAVILAGPVGRQFRRLSAYMSRQIETYQFSRRAVLWNFPPAFVRYLVFKPAPLHCAD